MKTLDEVIQSIKSGRDSRCLDGRDYSRLCDFLPLENWKDLGFKPKDGAVPKPPVEWSPENVRQRLESDVVFGFEKALGQRGISAGLMYEVVKMWLWVLDDPLQDLDDYAQYGLPLFKAVAVKYGFHNPIGNDCGNEEKYEEERY